MRNAFLIIKGYLKMLKYEREQKMELVRFNHSVYIYCYYFFSYTDMYPRFDIK